MRFLGTKKNIQSNSAIDMSGFMDVIFILLIFLMVSMSFSKQIKEIEMDLPNAEGVGEKVISKDISISIQENGILLINSQKQSLEVLKDMSKKGDLSNKVILLNVEKKVYYSDFMEVVKVLQSSRIKKLNLGLKD